jgi:hypothetical protein
LDFDLTSVFVTWPAAVAAGFFEVEAFFAETPFDAAAFFSGADFTGSAAGRADVLAELFVTGFSWFSAGVAVSAVEAFGDCVTDGSGSACEPARGVPALVPVA